MERAILEMEKIRKAEEIYSRRNSDNLHLADSENKLKNKSIYRILFQLLLLINIAIVIVAIQNKDYIFTKDFLKQINKYNVDIRSKINKIVTEVNNDTVVNSVENEIKKEEPLSQIDIDLSEIKENYSVILPLNGVKTSAFGSREEGEIVTANHTGIDIASDRGTVIKAAMSGKVTKVSSEGDYGKHLKITDKDLITLYAHCDEIYVEEGEEIVQGQDIAEVGSTGNSTGNHLHFEIIYKDRYINPEDVLGEI